MNILLNRYCHLVLLLLVLPSYLTTTGRAEDEYHPQQFGSTDAFATETVLDPEYASEGPIERLLMLGLRGGSIPTAEISEYPRIPALDNDDPSSFWYTWRANIMGRDVPVEWDFQNLVNTDRPDFTDATYSVGRDVTVIENGYTFRHFRGADGVEVDKRRLPESLLRHGVTDELELRIKWNGYVTNDVNDPNTGLRASNYGTDDLIVGLKYELWQQHGWVPMMTFVGSSTVPTGTRGYSANQMQPTVNFVYGWGIRRWLYLKMSTNVDFLRNTDPIAVVPGPVSGSPVIEKGVDNTSEWHQSASLLFQVSKRVGGFVEWWAAFQNNGADNRAAHFVDTGMFFYVSRNVQLDIRIGQRLSDRVDYMFTGAGLSVRY